jgi:hypothetical protein
MSKILPAGQHWERHQQLRAMIDEVYVNISDVG